MTDDSRTDAWEALWNRVKAHGPPPGARERVFARVPAEVKPSRRWQRFAVASAVAVAAALLWWGAGRSVREPASGLGAEPTVAAAAGTRGPASSSSAPVPDVRRAEPGVDAGADAVSNADAAPDRMVRGKPPGGRARGDRYEMHDQSAAFATSTSTRRSSVRRSDRALARSPEPPASDARLAALVSGYWRAVARGASDPRGALVDLRRLRADWPSSPIAHEVDLAIVQLEVASDHPVTARAEARRFVRDHPDSPHREWMIALLRRLRRR